MIKTTDMLLEELKQYKSPQDKITRLVKNGEYFPIVRGLYETNEKVSPHLLAASIYGPSYLSFEFALSFYALIPERVDMVTSATFKKHKTKIFETAFGRFFYRDVPPKAFPYGVEILQEGEYYYRIAGMEKALCDKLYDIKPVGSQKELFVLLEEDLRIDRNLLLRFDKDLVDFLSTCYHSTNVKIFSKLLRRIA